MFVLYVKVGNESMRFYETYGDVQDALRDAYELIWSGQIDEYEIHPEIAAKLAA
jgi:hypothetical protein